MLFRSICCKGDMICLYKNYNSAKILFLTLFNKIKEMKFWQNKTKIMNSLCISFTAEKIIRHMNFSAVIELREIHLHFVFGHLMLKACQQSVILTIGTKAPVL